MRAPTWRQFLSYWIKFGFLSFGGPTAQIGILHRDLVDQRRWLDEDEFSQALAFVSQLPGPEAHQLATYIGRKHFGVKGGVVAGGLFLIPSLFIISGLTWLYLEYAITANVDVLLEGLRTGVLALLLYTVYRLAKKIQWDLINVVFAMTFIILGVVFQFSILALVAIALGIGLLTSRTIEKTQKVQLDWKASLKPLLIGGLLWAISFGLIYQSEELRHIASLFTQAALITFGGAYSVVPFVSQAAVEQYGWLTQSQMLDGIALGETTPGPLIMINAFVGFIAYKGFLGALMATWFTFLPSFILVFAGAPLMQSLSRNQRIQATLSKLTIAVITFIAGFAFTIAQSLPSQSALLQTALAGVGLIVLVKTRIPVIALLAITTIVYSFIATFAL